MEAAKKTAAPKSEKKAEPKKRKTLTVEERIAQREAELKELREKAEAKARKQRAEVVERLNKLVAKRDALNEQIASLYQEAHGEEIEGAEVVRSEIGAPTDETSAES